MYQGYDLFILAWFDSDMVGSTTQQPDIIMGSVHRNLKEYVGEIQQWT